MLKLTANLVHEYVTLSQEKKLFASFPVLLLEHQCFRTFPG